MDQIVTFENWATEIETHEKDNGPFKLFILDCIKKKQKFNLGLSSSRKVSELELVLASLDCSAITSSISERTWGENIKIKESKIFFQRLCMAWLNLLCLSIQTLGELYDLWQCLIVWDFDCLELTSGDTLCVSYLSSQYCVQILWSCWTVRICSKKSLSL